MPTTSEQARQVASATAEQATNANSIVQATGQMRKIAQEVAKAVGEQGRAARDVMKAAQGTTKAATQVRKATAEQAKSAVEITQAVDSMRRGVGTTTRALSDTATASEQVLRSARQSCPSGGQRVARDGGTDIGAYRRSPGQSPGCGTKGSRRRRPCRSRRARFKNVAAGSGRAAKHIKQITRANAEHSKVSADLLEQMDDVRRITTRNAVGVKDTRGNTSDLLSQTRILNDLMDGRLTNGGNGRRRRTAR